MTRRHRRDVVVCLRWALIGLAVTVAVSWGFAFHSIRDPGELSVRQVRDAKPGSFSANSRLPPGAMGLTKYSGTGVLVLVGEAVAPDFHELPGIPFELRGTMAGTPEENAPRWAHSDVFPWLHNLASWPSESNGAKSWDRCEVDARGWPLAALYCVRALPAEGRDDLRGGFVLTRRKWVKNGATPAIWPHPVTLPVFPGLDRARGRFHAVRDCVLRILALCGVARQHGAPSPWPLPNLRVRPLRSPRSILPRMRHHTH
jgi:hypothetical protein